MISGDPDLRARFRVAGHLRITLGQLDDMPEAEFRGWLAYLASIKAAP